MGKLEREIIAPIQGTEHSPFLFFLFFLSFFFITVRPPFFLLFFLDIIH